jgi:site-specific DNA-methyltransferase (cytosine-N4-specific)
MMIKIHNVFETWPLEDKSVQAIITSPPYWSLRKYDIPDVVIGKQDCAHEFGNNMIRRLRTKAGPSAQCGNTLKDAQPRQLDNGAVCIKCNAWKGQHGLEPTYQQYIEHTRLWAKEAWRVLRDDGVFFLNLGDSYSASGGQGWTGLESKNFKHKTQPHRSKDLKPKCKILIPHRVAVALIDDGWILRNDIIWFKPNSMPEPVKDRFKKCFEFIFFFTKQTRYYFDLDSVREREYTEQTLKRLPKGKDKRTVIKHKFGQDTMETGYASSFTDLHLNPKGKNPGDLWQINTQPSPFKHYAMWPEKLVERMILCSTKKEDPVLDPFAGSGSTLYVAEKLNRKGIGFDLGYQDIQKIRLSNIQKDLL